MIKLITAMDENGLIGRGNDLPWGKLPADMEHFRRKTVGKTVLMGRKTYESIGKPLPQRKNIVMSKTMLSNGNQYFFESEQNLLVSQDMDIIFKFARASEVYVIGGAEIYKKFINLADTIYMTQIHGEFEGDTYFPLEMIDYREWEETETTFRDACLSNPYDMTFRTLKRLT